MPPDSTLVVWQAVVPIRHGYYITKTETLFWTGSREVERTCADAEVLGYAKPKIRPIYIGTFDTHVADPEKKRWYFALGVLRVTNG